MKYIVILILLFFTILINENSYATSSTIITPNSSNCVYEGPYDQTTGNFNCASIPVGNSGYFMQSPYSYVIFQNSTGYYSQNGQTGNIDFQSSDASTIIQNTWNRISFGDVYIKNGTYNINSQVLLSSTLSQSKNFIMSDSASFKATGNFDSIVKIYGGNLQSYYLSNINGENYNTKGVIIQNTDESTIKIKSILGANGSLIIDASDNNNLGGNEISLLSTDAHRNNGIVFYTGPNGGAIQGNHVYFNFITGAKHALEIYVKNNNFAYNEIHGNAIDDAGITNACGIYVTGQMTGNYIHVDGFVGGNAQSNVCGNSTLGSHTNAALLENTKMVLALADNKLNIVGDRNLIQNTAYDEQGSVDTPIIASNVTGLSNFNNGIALYSNKDVLSLPLPSMTIGQTKTFYFYNTLITGPVDGFKTYVIDDGGYTSSVSSVSSDPGWGYPNLGIITIRSLGNNPSHTLKIMVEVSN